MSEEKKVVEILSRESKATTKRTKVKLDEIKTSVYCHRPEEELEDLTTLEESLTLEGLQVPLEYFINEDGQNVLLKGHRRLKAMRNLADKNVPGFSRDMEVEAIEVDNASPVDLLIRSISDNEVRLNLNRTSRIRVAKKLFDAKVDVKRAARAMGTSVKTYERDLLIAQHQEMFDQVIAENIAPTHAYALLVEAKKADRLSEMQHDLNSWIQKKKEWIDEKNRIRRERDNKEFSENEKKVKRYMPNFLVTHWVELIREKKGFDDDAQWNFAAGVDKEKAQLRVSSVTLDLEKAPVERIARVAAKLSAVSKQIAPYLKAAHEKEMSQEAGSTEDSTYDLDYLRELGLDDVANELEEQSKIAKQPDGEEIPQDQLAERTQKDLTQEVVLPQPTSALPPSQGSSSSGKEAPKP